MILVQKANDEGLFVIESEYFRDRNDKQNDKKYFMYIDNSKVLVHSRYI